jgi:hypothetical protein
MADRLKAPDCKSGGYSPWQVRLLLVPNIKFKPNMLKSQILLKPFNNSVVRLSIFTVTPSGLPAVSLYTLLAVPLMLLSFPTLVVGV